MARNKFNCVKFQNYHALKIHDTKSNLYIRTPDLSVIRLAITSLRYLEVTLGKGDQVSGKNRRQGTGKSEETTVHGDHGGG